MRQNRLLRGLTIFAMVLATLFALTAVAWSITNLYYGQMLQRELESLKAEGYPLTVMEAAPKPIPADRNAAMLYLPLFEVNFDRLQTGPEGGGRKEGLNHFKLPEGFKTDMPSALAAREVIESADCQRALAQLRQASLRPDSVFPVRWEDGFNALFPHLAQFRQAARLVAAQALLKAHDGKLTEALEWLAVGYRMADHVAGEPSLIAQLVAYAIRGAISDRAAQSLLARADVPAALGRPLYDQLGRADIESAYQAGMKMELAQGLTMIESIRRGGLDLGQLLDDQTSPYASVLSGVMARTLAAPLLKLEEANYASYMHRSLQISTEAYRQSVEAYKQLPVKRGLGNILAGQLVPAYSRANGQRDRCVATVRLLQTVLALKAHGHERGSYPAGLGELAWLPPTEDPFSGKAFGYRLEGGGFVLYSIGPNLKDDGGKEPSKPSRIMDEGDMVWACPK